MKESLANLLTDQELALIDELLDADELPFSKYVVIANLNPAVDFRYADLRFLDLRQSDIRGYDFTGADLRFSIKDRTTKEDQTTIYDGADLEWLSIEAIPIVDLMMGASQLDTGRQLRATLAKMVDNHPFSSSHIDRFLLQEMERSRSLERFVELADFLSGSVSLYDQRRASETLAELIRRKGTQPRRKPGRSGGYRAGVEKIMDVLQGGKSRFMQEVGDRANLAVVRNMSDSTSGSSSTEGLSHIDLADAVRAPRRAPEQSRDHDSKSKR